MLMKLEPVDLCSYEALDWQGELGSAGLACEEGAMRLGYLNRAFAELAQNQRGRAIRHAMDVTSFTLSHPSVRTHKT